MRYRILLFTLIFLLALSVVSCDSVNDYSAVTGNLNSRVAIVKLNNEDIELNHEFILNLQNSLFEEYKGEKGGTTHRRFDFFDDENNLLYSVVDLGNRNLISVIINERETTYKLLRKGD